MKSKTQRLCHTGKKIKKMKKILFVFAASVCDGGAMKRTRTCNSHCWWQLQVKCWAERAIKRPRL